MLGTTRATTAAPRRRVAAPRALAWPAAALLVLGVAACGDDSDEVDGGDAVSDEGSALPGLDANGMLGLEVTVVGEVSEMLDNNAFRMDKDGLDPTTAPDTDDEPLEEEPLGADGDLDYYDTDALTSGDDELGYGTDQENVLVLVPNADLDLRSDDPVRVSGTIRALDAEAIEELYGVAIDADVYAPYENQLVIIAESVGPPFP